MSIDQTLLDMNFESVGVRNSQQRLRSLIAELAVGPLKQQHRSLGNDFALVEDVVQKRVAAAIAYWCENKHDPVVPSLRNKMSEITNANKQDVTLAEFYASEVRSALHTLAPSLNITIPTDYSVETDELEFALLELEERMVQEGNANVQRLAAREEAASDDETFEEGDAGDIEDAAPITAAWSDTNFRRQPTHEDQDEHGNPIKEITIVEQPSASRAIEMQQQQSLQADRVSLTTEQAWQLIYGFIGFSSEYIQTTMLPRWQQYPNAFDTDRRFLYSLFIDTLRNAAGMQYVAGNFQFADGSTVDQMWSHYFSDLSQNVGPILTSARLLESANAPWHKKLRQQLVEEMRNLSPIWLLALAIALIFDGLTTYISLDQTPMEGLIVGIFTVLITALFQIADQLVISYRQREFDAEALAAKYRAQYQRINKSLEGLDTISESFVRLSMERSKAHADWKAAEDNRKMARRGRFWSARIADINVVVTAYGFSFLFLNSTEPMQALVEQFEYISAQAWASIDPWVFLMVGLAVTVSFVVNTAQRTEILGWSMRRLKKAG